MTFLPLERSAEGGYALDPAYLGRLNLGDISRFASLAGVAHIFPSLDKTFIRELFDARLSNTLLIHGASGEDLRHRLDDFRQLQKAIAQRCRVHYTYRKDDGSKPVTAEPYRLINHNGIWYLAALHEGRPKAYAFAKISSLRIDEQRFEDDPVIRGMIDTEDSIWLNTQKTEAVLAIAAPVANYFRRQKLIAQQVIEKELEDGGLIISGRFAHPNQLLPIVRYYLPHIRIVSPESWQELMESDLKAYFQT